MLPSVDSARNLQKTPVMFSTARYLCSIFQRNSVSAQWTCTASVLVSSISDFWNGRYPRSFHQARGSSTQIWTQWSTKFAFIVIVNRPTCGKVMNKKYRWSFLTHSVVQWSQPEMTQWWAVLVKTCWWNWTWYSPEIVISDDHSVTLHNSSSHYQTSSLTFQH